MLLPQRFVATCRRTRRRITLCNMCIVRFLCRFFLLRGSSILPLYMKRLDPPFLKNHQNQTYFCLKMRMTQSAFISQWIVRKRLSISRFPATRCSSWYLVSFVCPSLSLYVVHHPVPFFSFRTCRQGFGHKSDHACAMGNRRPCVT